jgi:hypothetical protein
VTELRQFRFELLEVGDQIQRGFIAVNGILAKAMRLHASIQLHTTLSVTGYLTNGIDP